MATVDDSLSASGPGGVSVTAKGWVTIVLIIAAILGGLIFYLARDSRGEHAEISQVIREQTCVLSLSQDERIQLRSDMRRNLGQAANVMAAWCPWILRPNGSL